MRQCRVVVHIVIVQLAAVSVTRILTETDIADHEQLRHRILDCRNRTLHRARHIPCTRTNFILIFGQTEHLDRRNPARSNLTRKRRNLIHRVVIASGHTRNLFLDLLPRHDKDRIDKITWRKLGFAHQIAHCG